MRYDWVAWTEIETERLLLRPPEAADFEGFCELHGDERSAKFIGGLKSRPLSWRALATHIGHWHIRGFGMFSVVEKSTGDWIGRAGPWFPEGWLQPEVGWGLVPRAWGKGYATEAALALVDHAFEELGWDEVVHLIDPSNAASIALAERVGSVNTGRTHELTDYGVTVGVWGQQR